MHQYEVKNKLMKKILILVVSSTLFGCVTTYQQPTVGKVTSDPDCPDYSEVSAGFYGGDGSSEEQAIEMVGVDYSPYRWIEENYPGSKPTIQALIHSPRTGLKYDLIKFQTPDGNEKSAYFWISGGFHCFLKNSGK